MVRTIIGVIMLVDWYIYRHTVRHTVAKARVLLLGQQAHSSSTRASHTWSQIHGQKRRMLSPKTLSPRLSHTIIVPVLIIVHVRRFLHTGLVHVRTGRRHVLGFGSYFGSHEWSCGKCPIRPPRTCARIIILTTTRFVRPCSHHTAPCHCMVH